MCRSQEAWYLMWKRAKNKQADSACLSGRQMIRDKDRGKDWLKILDFYSDWNGVKDLSYEWIWLCKGGQNWWQSHRVKDSEEEVVIKEEVVKEGGWLQLVSTLSSIPPLMVMWVYKLACLSDCPMTLASGIVLYWFEWGKLFSISSVFSLVSVCGILLGSLILQHWLTGLALLESTHR